MLIDGSSADWPPELTGGIDTTTWPLRVDLMRMDTEKHIAILIDQAGQMKGSNAATASSERFEDRREFG